MKMQKTATPCCALCQISSVGDGTPIEEISGAMKVLHRQMLDNTEVGITTGNGQTAVYIIASPGENKLKKNLLKLGFEVKHTFERRVGYPKTGDLQMYIKNL
jgi:hypothetical protein